MEVWNHYLCALSDSPDVLAWIDAQSAPRTLCYGHMLMQVRDMRASERFYIDLLGFTVRPAKPLADGRPFTAFRQGIALTSSAQSASGTTRQIDHMAFEVNDVRALAERLKLNDVQFQQGLHDGPYGLTVYVTDPDGNRIELYQVGASA
jgi:catechol-2,3-dioxygenase